MKQIAYIDTPIGTLEIAASSTGINSVKKVEEKKYKEHKSTLLTKCKMQLQEYFNRKRDSFDLKVDFTGKTEFNIKVWKELLNIPYGRTISYSEIAIKIGNPDAVRAVGLANKNNPIAIIVPCHRVIGKNGDLTGYFYGLDTKRQLLELENPLSFSRQGSLF